MALTFQAMGKGIKKVTANIQSNLAKQQAEARERREWERQAKKEALDVQKQEFRTQYSKQLQSQARVQARMKAKASAKTFFAPKQSPLTTTNPTFEALLFGKPKATTPRVSTPRVATSYPKRTKESKEVQILKKMLKEAQGKPKRTSTPKQSYSKGGQKKPGVVPDIFWKY